MTAPAPNPKDTPMLTRWMLNNDDDGHWYLVPVEQKDAFDEWVYGDDTAEQPAGVTPLAGHPNNVTFERPEHFGAAVTG